MKTKSLLGIGVPLFIIVLVIFIGILDIGVTIEKFSPATISKSSILPLQEKTENLDADSISKPIYSENNYEGPSVRTIKVKNDFIFSRFQEVNIRICISEISSEKYNSYLFPEIRYNLYVDERKFYSGNGFVKIDRIKIAPGETKTIEVKPILRNHEIEEYQNTTEIMIFEVKGGNIFSRKTCRELLTGSNQDGIRIKITE
jgi:hypothetical protein